MKIQFSYGSSTIYFNENIRYDYYPEVDLTQGKFTTAAGFDFFFERSLYRRNLYVLTWSMLAASKYKEMLDWIKQYPQGSLNTFAYKDPEGTIHEVRLVSQTIKFNPIGNAGNYVSGSLELMEMESK
jgi:hypothetical protein